MAEYLFFEPRSRRVVGERLLHIALSYGLVKKEEPEHGALSIRGSEDPFPLSFHPLRIDPWKEPSPYEEIRGEEESDGVFALTEAGETVIDTGEVLAPEYGAWSIWRVRIPFSPSAFFGSTLGRESPARSTRFAVRNRESDRRPVPLPDWLRDVAGKPVKPAAQDATVVRIDELEEQAEVVDGSLCLRWNVGDGRLQLTGSLEGKREESELEAPPISPDQIWFDLLAEEALIERWDMG